MEFRKYPKIKRLGTEETEGILEGTVFIQEKVDGANVQIWKKEDGTMGMGSRGREVTEEEFNGFVPYIYAHDGIFRLLTTYPEYHLYGEWLVKHSISYKETAYRKFYLFDIFTPDGRMNLEELYKVAEGYKIETPQLFAKLENPKLDDIMEFVGKTNLGEAGEGVVIKNFDFISQFGDMEYAKIVTEKFKEENAITFGGNNKASDSYWEMYIVNKYFTLARVQKVMGKIQPLVDKKLSIEHTARLIGTMYHDVISECMFEIQKKVKKIDFGKLSRLGARKTAKIYIDILNEDLSVAYGEKM